ncbi:Unsaturated rhamnogalacturonyl hydrolase YesR [Paenibacillus allorhizoplanae]|uniref:Unsaturated rhamnogalacturonyl hydrolase YesR n=1 Tax=Paenibacillus allorhizoplanae TaxID=2905648 RepID=A0ABM9CYA2_9BACL|nr:Unsaturated rhamnogalacturonyl hydrolase YesR [Paenibacillus allorhizoplanae]
MASAVCSNDGRTRLSGAAWCDEYIDAGIPGWTVNTCAMGHILLTLYDQTNDQKYLDLILSKVGYLENKALRFGDRVLQHTVSSNNDFPEQCWADTLFMAAYFLLRVGVKLKEKRLIDDALHQFFWHINYLQDEKNGLW